MAEVVLKCRLVPVGEVSVFIEWVPDIPGDGERGALGGESEFMGVKNWSDLVGFGPIYSDENARTACYG